jgi:hypothetical protein
LWRSSRSKNHQVASSDPKRHGVTQNVTDEDSNVETGARRTIDDLGFMLRGPITVMKTITWTFGAKPRTYHLAMDVIHQEYKIQIVQPWLESLSQEGERTLLGSIRLSSNAARDSLNNALEREEARYQRELEYKQKPLDQEVVEHLVAAHVNLLAAEEALQELSGRIDLR